MQDPGPPAADLPPDAEVLNRFSTAAAGAAAVVVVGPCGPTAAEVAKVTGSPRGTLLARVHRGRKALVRLVMEEVRRHAP